MRKKASASISEESSSPSIAHPIPPFCPEGAQVLILGSFPSVKSRESGFFYGHPKNRFWCVLAHLWNEDAPQTVEERKTFLTAHGIALWDVIASCRIEGSADSSIRDVIPNDIASLVAAHEIRFIFVNGKAAQALYQKHIFPTLGIPAIPLPSTSPANAAWSAEALAEAWRAVRR